MDEIFMKQAIKESLKALKIGEIPVGAVIVYKNRIIGTGYNCKEKYNDPTMHAEIIAIREASKKIKDWRLNKCSIYVTMEPCIMCMGAIIESRIENIIYGLRNDKTNELNLQLKINSNVNITEGICKEEIIKNTKEFFKTIRNKI